MIKKHNYNYIICGGGASGLLLIRQLFSDSFFYNKKILLIEKEEKKSNDRTWSYWEKIDGPLDYLVSKKWKRGFFKSKSFEKKFSMDPYTYKSVRAEDFYNSFEKLSTKYSNFFSVKASVLKINSKMNQVITDKGEFYGDFIFSSILDLSGLKKQKKYPILKQHFIGQFVETQNKIFDPETITFMDFKIEQKNETRFMYLLPYSKTKALIEYTLFSANHLKENEYINAIEKYLQKMNPGSYKILGSESGSIPMTAFKFKSANTKNLLYIGTAGGWTKSSTGYTFLNALNKTKSLKDYLKLNKPLNQFEKNNRFWFYDMIFLDVLDKYNSKGHLIFQKMFANNKPEIIFKFLAEKSSIWEEVKLFSSFKLNWFLLALLKRAFKSFY
tara:strand:- start:6403 stop:7557 length:1155 start_codon:yes stop_codon:yes gene_type:complete